MSRLVKKENRAEYIAVLGDGDGQADASLLIGGRDEATQGKFAPNLNAHKWHDEAWLNINHPDTVILNETEIYNEQEEKVELTAGPLTHRYRVKDKKTLEYDIILSAKPQRNSLTFNLDFPAGMHFWKQPESHYDFWQLQGGEKSQWKTLEEFTREFDEWRPEKYGCYVVYWTKGNHIIGRENYKTGKFCHINRPKVIDNNGDEIFADLDIDVERKTLEISVSPQWLNNAAYPIRIDPDIGYTSAGDNGHVDIGEINSVRVAVFNTDSRNEATSNGTATSMSTYVDVSECAANTKFKACLYDEGAAGDTPDGGDLNSYSTEQTDSELPGADGWMTIDFDDTAGSITSGVEYYAGFHADTADTVAVWYEITGGQAGDKLEKDDDAYAAGLPATFGSDGTGGTWVIVSVYYTYSEEGEDVLCAGVKYWASLQQQFLRGGN